MKRYALFLVLHGAIVIGLFTNCSKNSPTEPSTPTPAKLELSDSFLSLEVSSNWSVFTIKNVGDEKLTWSITEFPQWISVSKSEGELEKLKTDTVFVYANFSGLGLGKHSGSIKIQSNGGDRVIGCLLNITTLVPPNGSYSGTTYEGGSISYATEDNYVKSFRGSYFVNVGGTVYEMSNYVPSFGAMSYNSLGFKATSFSGYVLEGTFDGDSTITGTWRHDYGITSYTAKLK